MTFSQKWFTGLSFVFAPILVNLLWGAVEGSTTEAGDFAAKAEIYAKAATLNTALLCLIIISILCLGISYILQASDAAEDSNNPIFGRISSIMWVLFMAIFAGVLGLQISSIGIYESGKIQEATTIFMISESLGSSAFLLIGLAIIFFGKAIRDSKNKLQPNIILNIISFGFLIFGIILVIDAFTNSWINDSILGVIGWLGWHLMSIIFGITILRGK